MKEFIKVSITAPERLPDGIYCSMYNQHGTFMALIRVEEINPVILKELK